MTGRCDCGWKEMFFRKNLQALLIHVGWGKEKSRMSPSFLHRQQMDNNVTLLGEDSKKNE